MQQGVSGVELRVALSQEDLIVSCQSSTSQVWIGMQRPLREGAITRSDRPREHHQVRIANHGGAYPDDSCGGAESPAVGVVNDAAGQRDAVRRAVAPNHPAPSVVIPR